MTEEDSPEIPLDTPPPAPEKTITTEGGAARVEAALPIAPGAVLAGRYQIEAALGEGGSGTVYRAWDRVLGEPIAIKILLAERARERSWIRRLGREVKVARAIRHPNVCRVFELVHADGHWFVTMELGAGGTLRELLRGGRSAERPFPERLDDVRAVAAGLAAIHAVGIIHRDVTPQNVLRMADGRLVLSDFGLAIEMAANTTMHGGTPNYMPPETLLGARGDQRSDVWQLGVIVHEILFGVRPAFDRDGDRTSLRAPTAADASPVEEALAELCAECLASNPAARPATAMVVVGRVAAAELARPRTPLERAWQRARAAVRRHRAIASVGLAALVAFGVTRATRLGGGPPLSHAAGALGTLGPCADPRLLRSLLPPPEDAARRAEVSRIRAGLADAQALYEAGSERLAVERLGALMADARRVGYPPVLGEALVLLGQIEIRSGETKAVPAALEQAFRHAENSRDDQVKAEVAIGRSRW